MEENIPDPETAAEPVIVPPVKRSFKERWKSFWRLPTDPKKRRWRIFWMVVIASLVVGATVALALQLNNKNRAGLGALSFNGAKTADRLTGKLVKSDLDGVEYDSAVANRRPIGVMVENHPDARPQFGLTQASVIYEAIAEGGITRYLLVFGPKDAEKVGPVRSARTYFLDWALEYNAVYAHAGGAANALEKIHKDKTINEIDTATKPVMWRQPHNNVASEHTLYGNTKEMRNYAADKKWVTDKADFIPWTFVEDKRLPADRLSGSVKTVNIPYQGSYIVKYTYNADKNYWQRDLAGKPDIDASNNTQITPTNVIVQYMNRTDIVSAGKDVGQLDLYKGGDAIVFTGGKQIKAKWSKAGERKRTKFVDESGKEIPLTPGQTMIEVLQPGMTVTTELNPATPSTTTTTP